jgi:GNAT superfamily N-acetyltransferase
MRLVLRPAYARDAEAVHDVLHATYLQTWQPQLSAAARMRFESAGGMRPYVEQYLLEFHVAMDADHGLVGMVHWRADLVWALHVRPSLERNGAGHALLARAEAGMLESNVAVARVETDTFNTRSRGFYARHGYVEVAQCPDTEWDSGFTTVLLAKPLVARAASAERLGAVRASSHPGRAVGCVAPAGD